MNTELANILLQGGIGGSVIAVVVLFLHHLNLQRREERKDRENMSRDFAQTIRTISERSDTRSEKLAASMDKLTDKIDMVCNRVERG